MIRHGASGFELGCLEMGTEISSCPQSQEKESKRTKSVLLFLQWQKQSFNYERNMPTTVIRGLRVPENSAQMCARANSVPSLV